MIGVSMPCLNKALGFKSSGLPLDFETEPREMDVPMRDGTTRRLVVTVSKSRGKKHRVFLQCPICKNDYPAGRLHQHEGTGRCLPWPKHDVPLS